MVGKINLEQPLSGPKFFDYNIKDYGAALIKMAYLADSVIGKNEESEIKNETKVNTIKKEK